LINGRLTAILKCCNSHVLIEGGLSILQHMSVY